MHAAILIFWYNYRMNETHIPGIGSPIPPRNAVSVYTQDAMDDFPVLKAFQQYIDAEQAKARKRLLSLGIFFGILTGAIIAVFVVMLLTVFVPLGLVLWYAGAVMVVFDHAANRYIKSQRIQNFKCYVNLTSSSVLSSGFKLDT